MLLLGEGEGEIMAGDPIGGLRLDGLAPYFFRRREITSALGFRGVNGGPRG
ncbi:MAG: hypothetical protein IT582_00305, partial [Opitutaceae bacterium]|nr:hypothetical protein [Opitutaceae bacterium]